MANWLANMRGRSLAARQALLVLSMAGAFVLVLPWALWQYGATGLLAAASACGVCLLGSATALFVADQLRGPNLALQGMLLGLALRTGIPLGFAVIAQSSAGLLACAGLVYDLLVFYLVALAVEVALSLPPTVQPKLPESGAN